MISRFFNWLRGLFRRPEPTPAICEKWVVEIGGEKVEIEFNLQPVLGTPLACPGCLGRLRIGLECDDLECADCGESWKDGLGIEDVPEGLLYVEGGREIV